MYRLESAEGLVSVFCQRRSDGVITFAIHRVFEHDSNGKPVPIKTAFAPEQMIEAYVAHVGLTVQRLEKLKEMRAQGALPYPLGGERVLRRSAE